MGARPLTNALDAPHRGGLPALIAFVFCASILALAWSVREEGYLDAETPLGYRLGIAGSSMMLLLLLYSARKRMRVLSNLGPLRHWFRVHMWLGVAGPIAVLLHTNFEIGSLNSSIALVSMLLVAGSGIAGRVFYTKIHLGLYGRRLHLQERRLQLTETSGKLRPLLEVFPEVVEPITLFETRYATPPGSAAASIWRLATLRGRRLRLQRECNALLDPVLHEERRAARDWVRLASAVAEFSAYERLFRLWHVVHVPLFVMMAIALALHVVAVHMY